MPTGSDYVVRDRGLGQAVIITLSDPDVMLSGMPRTSSFSGLADLLEKQHSVVSRSQLLTLGLTDNAMQYRVRRGGPWQTLLPGVYLTASGVPSLPQKEMAAPLYAGPGSVGTA